VIKVHELSIPFGDLFGVVFYDGDREPTDAGYRQRRLDISVFPWKWYVHKTTKTCVRAVVLARGIRMLGRPLGIGPSACDVEAGLVLFHDDKTLWTTSKEEFDEAFIFIEQLLVEHGILEQMRELKRTKQPVESFKALLED